MVKKYRDLTEKYRSLRLHPDALYQSRTIQTLFNKFTKRGEKARARKQIMYALTNFRFSLNRPRVYNVLLRTLQTLQTPLTLLPRRQGKIMLEVPTPVRRNKADVASIQTLTSAVQNRRERELAERLEQELLDLTLRQTQSSTLRQRNLYMRRVHDERTNLEKR